MTSEPGPRIGPELIRYEASRAPEGPGVYRMLGDKGDVLYVGKAKSLKNRILQYAQGRYHTQRVALMVQLTRSMVLISTKTETEALLLEATLIKTLKPRYNVLLRDDKSFAELLVRKDHPAAQIRKHRGAHTIKGRYFGPFASTWAVNRTLDTLQRAFLLRTCTDSIYAARTRPCMLHQIKRCAAPCTGEIGLEAYNGLVSQAQDFLSGKSRAIMDQLQDQMQAASDDLDFEQAARFRDRLRALQTIQMETTINPDTVAEADVLSLHAEGGHACVQVVFYRSGQNWGDHAFYPRVDSSDTEGEILEAFLGQFYDSRPIPRLILVSHEVENAVLLADALSIKSGRKVEIHCPQRGDKKTLVENALLNARAALGRKLGESSAQGKLLAGVAETFGLESPPERIEVYDNSHIQGTNAVGGMIVTGPEGLMKSQYRRFNIRTDDLTAGDDYAMMRQVLTRRFSRLAEGDEKASPRPDLLLVDGGQGQLDVAIEVLAEQGFSDIPVVGVAKGPNRDAGLERFFMPGRAPFMLEPKSPVLYFLQRLRDEAHNYAIGTHRARRAKALVKSPFDEIEGVGPKRKKALLLAFGSAKDAASAAVIDLMKVDGVNEALAQRIYDYFHPQGERKASLDGDGV